MKKYIGYIIPALLVVIAMVLFYTTFFDDRLMTKAFSEGGYYIILAMFVAWLIILFEYMRSYNLNLRAMIRSNRYGILICLVFVAFIIISVKPCFRVLSDETNLFSVSRSMLYEKRTDNITTGLWYYNSFYPIYGPGIEKRPLLFPFLINIIHSFFGYRIENVFILNYTILFALLLLIYTTVKKDLGEKWAICAVALVAGQPIVSQVATSGAFDLCAALFIMITFISLRNFLKEPSAIRFQFLFINLLMLNNIRHEGIIAFIIVMGFLLIRKFGYIKAEYFKTKFSLVFFMAPLVFLLTLWQRLLTRDPFETKGEPAFSLSYFSSNNLAFLKSLVDYRFFLPYATIVDFIGFIGLLYIIYEFIAHRPAKEKWQQHLIIIVVLWFLASWTVFTSYHTGRLDHPSSCRYYVMFFAMLSVCVVYFVNRFEVLKSRATTGLVLSVIVFLIYNGISVSNKFTMGQIAVRKNTFVTDFLQHETEKTKNILVVIDRPGQLIVYNYGAVHFQYARANPGFIRGFKQHLVENVYVVQDIEYRTKKPVKGQELDDKFVLEPMTELQNTPAYSMRISKLVDIKDTKATKDVKEIKDAKETKDIKEAKDTKETKDAKDVKPK